MLNCCGHYEKFCTNFSGLPEAPCEGNVLSRQSRHLPLLASLLTLLLLLTVGCSAADPQNTLGSNLGIVAKKQADLFWTVFAWATIVFVFVESLLLFTVWRFRRREGAPEPHQTHGNTRLEIGWTVVPALILITVAVPTVSLLWELAAQPAVAVDVNVIGHQWWWEFQYPNMGTTDISNPSPSWGPTCPSCLVTANELHIPQGETVEFHLTSADVIHSFWVPKLGGKLDVVPGKTQSFWLRGDEPGMFYAQCAELCGIQHANMKFRVVVDTREKFNQWVQAQRQAPRPPDASALEGKGAEVFKAPANACVGCHTVQGVSAGKLGPNLTHIGSRTTIAAGVLDNTPENLKRWIHNPDDIKPGNLMAPAVRALNLSNDDLTALAAYLTSLK